MAANSASSKAPGVAGASMAGQLRNVMVGLRRDLIITRQIVRGGPRYVAHDPVAFRNHILTPLEYRILCAMVDHRTLGQTFEQLTRAGTLAPEDADEFYGFVAALHGMGLLVVPGMPVEVTWRRHVDRRRLSRGSVLRKLLSLRVPFGDPDRHLQRALPFVRWLFATPGFLLWALLATTATWQCGGRLDELYGGVGDLLALHNLPILWCCLVGMKALHELGHAFAIKRYGGSVPDFGVIFVMMTPCAYVDANASWTFANRWQRIVVGLAGMYVETLVASVFALVWAGTSDGLLHDLSRNIVVLATVTTVMININPLVRFDGYFILSDLLGFVNLQERATRHLRGVCEKVLLGLPSPADELGRSERLLIWFYAPASVLYRISLAFGITVLMFTNWPTMGLVLGTAFGWLLILDPIRRLFLYLWTSDRTAPVRLRARLVASATVIAAVFITALLPVSHSVVAQGVLDPGLRRTLRAPSSAFVEEVCVADGEIVPVGHVLCRLRDPQLEERQIAISSELAAARVQFDASEATDPTYAATVAARIEFLEKRAAELAVRAAALAVTVGSPGTVAGAQTVVAGDYVHQGSELLQVHSAHHFVRVVMTDRELTQTRLQVGVPVDVRWTSDPGRRTRGIVREIRRSASRYRVPVELTVAAGGQIYVRATGNETEASQPYLHVFVEADSIPVPGAGVGLTASVLFAAHQETLGEWMRRRLLTLFHNWRMG